jgi:hypothetical protein
VADQVAGSGRSAVVPHRVVIFIRVVGCGTRPSMPIRQNSRQPIESATVVVGRAGDHRRLHRIQIVHPTGPIRANAWSVEV